MNLWHSGGIVSPLCHEYFTCLCHIFECCWHQPAAWSQFSVTLSFDLIWINISFSVNWDKRLHFHFQHLLFLEKTVTWQKHEQTYQGASAMSSKIVTPSNNKCVSLLMLQMIFFRVVSWNVNVGYHIVAILQIILTIINIHQKIML